eukprot:SAG22_NODE_454_length_10311_cov_4.304446_1_plen_590_part_00
MVALALLLALTAQAAAAAPLPPPNSNEKSTAASAAEQVARAAQLLRSDATVAAALRSVNVGTYEYAYYEDHDSDPTGRQTGAQDKPRPAVPADRENPAPAGDAAKPAADSDPAETGAKEKPRSAEQALAAHGFATALDLRLLAGGPEAAELMTELRTGGKLSIADRGKIRLLVGDAAHLARVSMLSSSHPSGSTAARPGQGKNNDDQEGERAAPRNVRQLQEDGDSGSGALSAVTLAIVFSVLVGVLGYLFQAWHPTGPTGMRQICSGSTTRRPGISKSSTTGPRRRSGGRSGGSTTSVRRWVGLSAIMALPGTSSVSTITPPRAVVSCFERSVVATDGRKRCRTVAAYTNKLETTQPAAFAELYKGYSMKGLQVQDDGAVHWLGGVVALDPKIDFKGQTWGNLHYSATHFTGCSSAAVDVVFQDLMAFVVKYAYVRELPQAFFDLMAADLDGPLTHDYHGYIKHEVKPVLDSIKDLMHAHYAAIEIPPLEWLIETFPGHNKSDSPTNVVYIVVANARAWDRVLAEWDAGRLEVLFPPNHMMPFLGLHKLNTWSREQGETKQHELIGMSSGRKDASSKANAFRDELAEE